MGGRLSMLAKNTHKCQTEIEVATNTFGENSSPKIYYSFDNKLYIK